MTPKIPFAKPAFDVGFATNDLEEFRTLLGAQAGLAYDHLAKLGGGFHQHRWRAGNSIVKVNHTRAALPETPPGSYRALTLKGRDSVSLSTPDGAAIFLSPSVEADLTLHVESADLESLMRFYGDRLGLTADGPSALRLGGSRIVATQCVAAAAHADWRARGLRYMTLQVFDCDGLTSALAAEGVEVGQAPKTVGQVRYSFIRDPDGAWIELSERASLTGKPVKT